MRFERNRKLAIAVLGLVILVAMVSVFVYWRAGRALRGSEEALRAERDLQFTVRPLVPLVDTGFEWVSAPAVFREAAEFEGRMYVAGPTGLLEFDGNGAPGREFRVGKELPPAPLVKMARATLADSRQPELVIGTAGAGVLAFDGTRFRQILPEVREARTVTAILPLASGHLLIGTEKRGLLVYDGRRLGPFHSTLAQLHVTELAGSEADLWIGTQDRGVVHWHGGAAEWFGEAEGLPDACVYSIAIDGERAYVGTSAGIAEFERGKFSRVLAKGAFVRALWPRGKELLAGTMDDGVLEIALESQSRGVRHGGVGGSPTLRVAQGRARGDERSRRDGIPPSLREGWGNAGRDPGGLDEVEQLFESGDALYAVSARGVFARGNAGWKRVLEPRNGLLADRNVSALAMDSAGRLWVGYFDRGIDVVEPNGERARHVEDDRVFCVNRILPNAAKGATAVATANGLVLFDSRGNKQQVLGRADGLIAGHVTDVVVYRDGLALATPAGLTFLDSGGVRSLYAFHGLVNNHVYAIAAKGNRLLAGTLGGASVLEDDQVRASYTTATSGLKHNWITAAVSVGDEWWMGTYGAGVVKMTSQGKFEASEAASGDVVINPNAMVATERIVAAGSMGRGLFVMDRASGRWATMTDGLPSMNVTAVAAANGFLYVGTDNGLVRIPEQRLAR